MRRKNEAWKVDCKPGDEHILRRLGSALVVQWDGLSERQQEVLLDQATHMMDREDIEHPSVQLRQQIEIFIDKHKIGD